MKNIIAFILLLVLTSIKGQNIDEISGIKVGEKIQTLNGTTLDSTTFSFDSCLSQGPLVVVFYRGQWCPYCNKHLSRIQDSLDYFNDKGATVIAVSPEKPEYMERAKNKSGAEFTLIFDYDYSISKAFDVLFKPNQKTLDKYRRYGINLKKAHSDDSERLPVPATFVVGQDGIVKWRHFEHEYSKRSSVKEILKNL